VRTLFLESVHIGASTKYSRVLTFCGLYVIGAVVTILACLH